MSSQIRYKLLMQKQHELLETVTQMRNIQIEIKSLPKKRTKRMVILLERYFELGTLYFNLRGEIFEIKYGYRKDTE